MKPTLEQAIDLLRKLISESIGGTMYFKAIKDTRALLKAYDEAQDVAIGSDTDAHSQTPADTNTALGSEAEQPKQPKQTYYTLDEMPPETRKQFEEYCINKAEALGIKSQPTIKPVEPIDAEVFGSTHPAHIDLLLWQKQNELIANQTALTERISED